MNDFEVAITANLPDGWPYTTITTSNLYTKEGPNLWCARALEMDLEAYGPTQETAAKALVEMVVAQLVFAVQKKDPGLIMRPAPSMYWRLYEETRSQMMHRMISGADEVEDADISVGTMPIPAALLAAYQRKKPFKRQHAA